MPPPCCLKSCFFPTLCSNFHNSTYFWKTTSGNPRWLPAAPCAIWLYPLTKKSIRVFLKCTANACYSFHLNCLRSHDQPWSNHCDMRFADWLQLGYELGWSQSPQDLWVSKDKLEIFEEEEEVKEEKNAGKVTKKYLPQEFYLWQ